jgi:hypothetical protein
LNGVRPPIVNNFWFVGLAHTFFCVGPPIEGVEFLCMTWFRVRDFFWLQKLFSIGKNLNSVLARNFWLSIQKFETIITI